ncbi:hypothetical protein KQI86_19220 [Clostridium sp. MSJ-11]|uniref:Uncharacterized protein n=1 Tax=Clostridium mobile TaxID=2841512 RepID=A0ABS6EMG9_9CLOT|nr:hypothetical protein [Clostridium mobile]MBU5486435.1 hypothetical protein [Clostridium mobile]
MENDLEKKYKQFKIDLKTAKMNSDISDYNNISECINLIKERVEQKQSFVHEDDYNTYKVLEDVIGSLSDATSRLEDLRFYDGDGNRLS